MRVCLYGSVVGQCDIYKACYVFKTYKAAFDTINNSMRMFSIILWLKFI